MFEVTNLRKFSPLKISCQTVSSHPPHWLLNSAPPQSPPNLISQFTLTLVHRHISPLNYIYTFAYLLFHTHPHTHTHHTHTHPHHTHTHPHTLAVRSISVSPLSLHWCHFRQTAVCMGSRSLPHLLPAAVQSIAWLESVLFWLVRFQVF